MRTLAWHCAVLAQNAYDEFVDDSEPSLYVISAPAYISDGVIEEACSRIRELLERGERVAICWNLTGMNMVTGAQRRRLMQFQRDEIKRFSEHFIAEAYVMRSVFVRGLIVAVESFARPSHPTRTFHDLDTAKVWLRHLISNDEQRGGVDTKVAT